MRLLLLTSTTLLASVYAIEPLPILEYIYGVHRTSWFKPGEYNAVLKERVHPIDYSRHLKQTARDLEGDNIERDMARKGQGLPPVTEEERYRILDVRPDGYLYKAADHRTNQIHKNALDVGDPPPFSHLYHMFY